jgi:hypothetical protein
MMTYTHLTETETVQTVLRPLDPVEDIL